MMNKYLNPGRPGKAALWISSFLVLAILSTGAWLLPQPGEHPIRNLEQSFDPPRFSSLEQWLERAAELKDHIWISTGLWPLPEKTPLHPRVSKPLLRGDYTIRNVVLETYPGFFLTGNLYAPSAGAGPWPAVLSAHGHWKNGRFEDTETASVPGRAITLARRGFVVFTYSMIGYNEMEGLFPHRFDAPRFQLWGYSAMGLQLWNSLRALDFLSSLPEVDAGRLAMTGASGGGTQTYLLTGVDDRLRASAPVNMISARYQGGCVCENAPLLRIDAINTEFGALAAPRPLLMVSTSGDWTRDTPRVEFPAIQAVYRLFDAADQVSNVHLDYPHNYNQESRLAVYRWFSRWLQAKDRPATETAFQVEPEASLRAELPDRPKDMEELFSFFVQQAKAQVEATLPTDRKSLDDFRQSFGPAYRHLFSYETAQDVPDLQRLSREEREEAGPAVLVVYPNRETARSRALSLAESYRSDGRWVFLISPFPAGDGFAAPEEVDHWTTYNPTVAGRRVAEIRNALLNLLGRREVSEVSLVGVAEAGPWAFLARALVPEVQEATIDFNGFQVESDQAFLDHLFVPLIRRAGDFRTAGALIVPAPLSLANVPDGPFKVWLAQMYSAAGAAEHLRFVASF